MTALGVFALSHLAHEPQALVGAAIAKRRIAPWLGQCAAAGAHVVGALRIDIGVASLHQPFGKCPQLVEIVACVVEIVLAVGIPVESQPAHRIEDRINVFLVFLDGVGIVKAHVASAAIIARQAKIQADGFGMPNMQIAVGLRRKAGADSGRVERGRAVLGGNAGAARPVAACMTTCRQV